jgi:formylglycine-generating enzyme required for sulfatase activity
LTLKLATVREDGEPTRRRAFRSEFSDEEWRLVSELADHPNRLLVTATPEGGETYAEVAHEAIFRRWDKLREWIAAEREFLAWRSGLESARRAWQATPDRSKNDALLMGHALAQGQSWHTKRAEDIPAADRAFILQSRKAARQRKLRVQALVGVLVAALVAGAAAWWKQDWLKERVYAMANVTALKTAQERALKPKDPFKECTDCPEMIVVPAGGFMMGSSETEKGRRANEGPQHNVTVAKPFAVAKYELTFAEWDACVAHGDCDPHISDSGWGRGQQPAINVIWNDAQTYVAWLSRITGKKYRLLSEAEYEYAARAGTQTAYPWGDEIGKNNANCGNCDSQWDGKQTAPVGSFAANGFGLYDMVGNVWEWTEDCYHNSYNGAPADGAAWTGGDCGGGRVVRGGSWGSSLDFLRSAYRLRNPTVYRDLSLGFRVGRTLVTP